MRAFPITMAGAALAMVSLAACSKPEQPTYDVDATDKSGGELIVNQEDPNAVPVTVPETAMTPAPDETLTPTPTPTITETPMAPAD